MTVYAETDFLLALTKDSDWLKPNAEAALEEYDIRTSMLSYVEFLLIADRFSFDTMRAVANLLELVPVESEQDKQIILKATKYRDGGMTTFDSFHAATANSWEYPLLGSDQAYKEIDVERIPLEPE